MFRKRAVILAKSMNEIELASLSRYITGNNLIEMIIDAVEFEFENSLRLS